MSVLAIVPWVAAIGFGLYLLAIWLIEYDRSFQSVAATRLPPLVLSAHALLAIGGLVLWVTYLIFDDDDLVPLTAVVLVVTAALGTTMAVRWISVYRAYRVLRQAPAAEYELAPEAGPPAGRAPGGRAPGGRAPAGRAPSGLRGPGPEQAPSPGRVRTLEPADVIGPPERNFPLPVVIAHGAFAVATLTLVLLTAFGVGES